MSGAWSDVGPIERTSRSWPVAGSISFRSSTRPPMSQITATCSPVAVFCSTWRREGREGEVEISNAVCIESTKVASDVSISLQASCKAQQTSVKPG